MVREPGIIQSGALPAESAKQVGSLSDVEPLRTAQEAFDLVDQAAVKPISEGCFRELR